MAVGDPKGSHNSKLIRHRKACRDYYERNKERLRATQRIKAKQRRAKEREQKHQKTTELQPALTGSEQTKRCCCCGQLMPPCVRNRQLVGILRPCFSEASPEYIDLDETESSQSGGETSNSNE